MKVFAGGAAALAVACGAATASAAPVLWDVASGGNGHYYELRGLPTAVSAGGAPWSAALADAGAQSYLGLQGYLVTITSAAERDFLGSLVGTAFWAAGSDQETEGVWKWVAGPEAGQIFWNGSTVTYANWWFFEPDAASAGVEDVLLANVTGPDGLWFDATGSDWRVWYVEYSGLTTGGVPEPGAWALMILGFGTAGAALRRRRAATAV